MSFDAEPPYRLVGRYLLCGEFAEGGMATVHFGRVLGTSPPEVVAIKKPHQHFASHPDCAQLFREEAALAMRIEHPNVVPMLDVVALGEELFLVMEYVAGETLGSLVRAVRKAGGRVPPGVLGSLMVGMLEGLHAAHETRGDEGEPLEIVHRDVSPHNVIVGVDGRTRVLDFGVAKALGRVRTVADEPMTGKLSYMAPEQVRGASVDRRADLYAASILLWESVTTKRLFTGATDRAIIIAQLSNAPAAPSSVAPDVPEGLDAVVLKGLAKTPESRYATALEMADAIRAVLPVATDAEVAAWIAEIAKASITRRAERATEIREMPLPAEAAEFERTSLQSLPPTLAASKPPLPKSKTGPPVPRAEREPGFDPLTLEAPEGFEIEAPETIPGGIEMLSVPLVAALAERAPEPSAPEAAAPASAPEPALELPALEPAPTPTLPPSRPRSRLAVRAALLLAASLAIGAGVFAWMHTSFSSPAPAAPSPSPSPSPSATTPR